jgi:hypothetical protein
MSPTETLFGNVMWLSTDDCILNQHALSYKRKKCRRPPRYVPYKGAYVPYDGTYGAPDQGQTLDV